MACPQSYTANDLEMQIGVNHFGHFLLGIGLARALMNGAEEGHTARLVSLSSIGHRRSDIKGKTLFITGASRGIGLAIALRAAQDGANVAIAAKTTEPHPKLPGTIYTAAEEIERRRRQGAAALAMVDIRRDEAQIVDAAEAVAKTVATFGGIDILVNNASAISLTGTDRTPHEALRPDAPASTCARHLPTSQACIPHLKKAANPHILNLSPPLNMDPKWFETTSPTPWPSTA
jgi:citronellol/citronellal dehydrogenase